ncbi:MAG: 4Fe-4S dicluster domain-containing protein [Saprospiraceae bacterium]|nr:4Fe-4S dicluster domain-containing protein [Saprospiraceae bacterium]
MGIQQLVFLVVSAAVFFIAFKKYKQIYRNIFLGKPQIISDHKNERWKNVILVAFGQKKMFKNFIPAIFHLFIYVAFLLTQIELIEILLDGILGKHRIFAEMLGGFYTFLLNSIEVLSLLALVATFVFLYRRNLLKIPRFVKSELNGWPKLDANLILIGEIFLVTGIFLMNSSDGLLQKMDTSHYPFTGDLVISSVAGSLFLSDLDINTLQMLERTGWWLHLFVVYGFILYLPYSKHFHVFLAFPNVYFSRLEPRGEMENMPAIMNEVKGMFGLPVETTQDGQGDVNMDFGAKDVFDFSWKTILDAYSCTECGRCTAVCPANLTGKKLSPRKILMDIRDRATEIGDNIDSGKKEFFSEEENTGDPEYFRKNYNDGKNLFSYISREEIHACTTCNACVEACPVLINPLEPILELRRYEILSESAGPPDWVPMFTAMENGGCVWQMPEEREKWRTEIGSPS